MCAIGYHGRPVLRMLFFTLSKGRKAKVFQSPTCIATVAVPSLVPDATPLSQYTSCRHHVRWCFFSGAYRTEPEISRCTDTLVNNNIP